MSDDLIKQWDEYVESVGSVTVAVTHLLGRAEAAEAKLAKAMEALHFYADFYEVPNDGPWGINSDDFGNKARTTLAELEGGE